MNVSTVASQVMLSRLASYIELDTVLGLEDVLNILEVHQVAEYNRQAIEKYGNEHH